MILPNTLASFASFARNPDRTFSRGARKDRRYFNSELMIYLLGGSGYVGGAFKRYFERKGIPFRNVSRSQVDYTDLATLTAALRVDRPQFLINAAG